MHRPASQELLPSQQGSQDLFSESILDKGMDESNWMAAVDYSDFTSATMQPPSQRSQIDLELDVWLNQVPQVAEVDIDILSYWKTQTNLPLLQQTGNLIFKRSSTKFNLFKHRMNKILIQYFLSSDDLRDPCNISCFWKSLVGSRQCRHFSKVVNSKI